MQSPTPAPSAPRAQEFQQVFHGQILSQTFPLLLLESTMTNQKGINAFTTWDMAFSFKKIPVDNG